MTDARVALSDMLKQYRRTRRPINVCFRDLLDGSRSPDRASHGLHPYPAKLLQAIPQFFFNAELIGRDELVVDPFCGSGTVLVEAAMRGFATAGADINPLARLVTRVKITVYSEHVLRSSLRRVIARFHASKEEPTAPPPALRYWFHPHVIRDLSLLLSSVKAVRQDEIRQFFLVCVSASLRHVSLADPRLSVPVRLRLDQYPSDHWLYERTKARLSSLRYVNVLRVFTSIAEGNISRVTRFSALCPRSDHIGLAEDARILTPLADESTHLIVTSPPYVGAQKYIRASRLSLVWLGASDRDLRSSEHKSIGRERVASRSASPQSGLPEADRLLSRIQARNATRAVVAATYLDEMRSALREMHRVLAPSRHAVLVAGAGHLAGLPFPTPRYLAAIAEEEGFKVRLHLVDRIRSRALMTKRNKTAGVIDTESVLLLQKEGTLVRGPSTKGYGA